jgi:tetratricopeptide (TPR) repeat protein
MRTVGGDVAISNGLRLPVADDLSPENAMTLASELIAADVLEPAIPYLIRALRAKPTAFGLCRLARLCQRRGDVRDGARYYGLALELEPGNAWALIGRASALAECLDATFTELLAAAEPLPPLTYGQHGRRAMFALADVLTALERLRGQPALHEAAQAIRAMARAKATAETESGAAYFRDRLLATLAFLVELAPEREANASDTPRVPATKTRCFERTDLVRQLPAAKGPSQV